MQRSVTPGIWEQKKSSPFGGARNNYMPNTYVSNILHIVFHIKAKGTPFLDVDLQRIYQYIGGVVKGLGAILIEIGGTSNHVHLLVSLPKTMSLADFMRTVKAESSRWIKTINPYYGGFSWQNGYGAFSVSASVLPKVKQYILNQEEHHKTLTFRDEYKAFLQAYGIEYDERYL